MLGKNLSTRHVDDLATQWRRLSGKQDAARTIEFLVCLSFVWLLNARQELFHSGCSSNCARCKRLLVRLTTVRGPASRRLCCHILPQCTYASAEAAAAAATATQLGLCLSNDYVLGGCPMLLLLTKLASLATEINLEMDKS